MGVGVDGVCLICRLNQDTFVNLQPEKTHTRTKFWTLVYRVVAANFMCANITSNVNCGWVIDRKQYINIFSIFGWGTKQWALYLRFWDVWV